MRPSVPFLGPRIESVLGELESRSRKEQQELEVLRSAGGTALRERAGSFMLDVGPEAGLFLNTLVRVSGARAVVEIGGSVGYSTLWLAEAVRATGGRLYSIEVDKDKQDEQRANLTAAGLDAHVELTTREAPELVPSLHASVDLVLLDHWKELYIRDFEACWPVLRPGGMIVADNVLVPQKNAEVIARYRRHVSRLSDAQSQMLAVGDGLEATIKRENVSVDRVSGRPGP